MPRPASSASAAWRSRRPSRPVAQASVSTPRARIASIRSARASGPCSIQTGGPPVVSAPSAGRSSRRDSTTRTGCGPAAWAAPMPRTVRRGSSARAVPAPTITASWRARSAWTCARASGPVIQRLSPEAVAMRPSSVVASLSVSIGRPAHDARDEAGLQLARLGLAHALHDLDPGRAQPREPRPVGARVGVAHRHHDPRDPRRDQRVGAGRRRADMRAGLQRDVRRGPPRGRARLRERPRLGVRPAAVAGARAAEHGAAALDHAADRRVGPAPPEPARGERERVVHEPRVAHADGGGRSSWTKASKSSAAWKFLYTLAKRT